jgi:galactoside O-acetyltransferase
VAEEVLNGLRPLLAEEAQPVRICAKAWVARGCVVLKGTTVGEGAIVGAGSVVVQDIPPFSIAMGNPARVVGRQEQ